ncbi:MAG: hypothetical protein ACI9RO_002247 [Alteromonas macleodii]|jgi:hypothetical protein
MDCAVLSVLGWLDPAILRERRTGYDHANTAVDDFNAVLARLISSRRTAHSGTSVSHSINKGSGSDLIGVYSSKAQTGYTTWHP